MQQTEQTTDLNGRSAQEEAQQVLALNREEEPHPAEDLPASDTEQQGSGGPVPGGFRPLAGALVQGLEHQGEQWLRSLITARLDALFSDAGRDAIQRHAEQGLRTLIREIFEALPEGVVSRNRDLQAQTEQTLLPVLRETLDVLFAGPIQAALQQHGEQAVRAVLRRDFETAREHGEQPLQVLLHEILAALRRQWQRVLRLVLKLTVSALQDSLSSTEQEKP